MNNKLKRYHYILAIAFLVSCGAKKTKNQEGDDIYYFNYENHIQETNETQKFDIDLVPDEKTAIKLAEAIWYARYKYEKKEINLPYIITLESEKVWYIKTSLPKNYMGQIFFIKINKYDGRILYVWSEL